MTKAELLRQKEELTNLVEELWERVNHIPDGEEYEFQREGLMDCAHEAQEDLDNTIKELESIGGI